VRLRDNGAEREPLPPTEVPSLQVEEPHAFHASRERVGGYGGAAAETLETIDPVGFAWIVWDPNTSRWVLAWPTSMHDIRWRLPVRLATASAVDPRSNTLYLASTGTGEIASIRGDGRGARVDVSMTVEAPSAIAHRQCR
jgi:hypothetical protein